MGDKIKAHCRPERGTDVLINFQKEKGKRQARVCKRNKAGRGQKQQLSEHRGQEETKWKGRLIFGGIIVGAAFLTWILETFFYELVLYIARWDMIGSFLSLTGVVANVIADAAKQKNGHVPVGFINRFIEGGKCFIDVWRGKPIFTFYLVVLILVNAVVFGSKYTICAKAAEWISDIRKSIAEYIDNAAAKERRPNPDPVTSNEEKKNNNEESSDDEGAFYIYSGQEMIEQFGKEDYWLTKNIIVSEDDRMRELYLSSVDYDALFQLDGEYKIKNWDDQEEIDTVVLKMIEDEISLRKQNRFDGEAPGLLQANVNEANIKEAEMHTFDERIEMIGIRTEAYWTYHKSSLAQLIANDNQALALALVLNDGKKQTELYYYGESVFWGLEYLGFADVSTGAVKEKVNWIAERYKDIQFICSETDPEYRYAEKLMIAYKHAANNF